MSSKQNRRPAAPVRNPSRRAASTTRWWVIGGLVVVLVVAVVVALAASGGGDDDDSSSTAKQEVGAVTVDGTSLPAYDADARTDAAVGDTAPTLEGSGFDEQPVTIGPTGNPQVVMFLAHWCPHCQAEVPRIVTLADQGAFEGIDVASVATGTSADAPNYPPSAWLTREDWPFEVLVDDRQGTAAAAYGLSAYPFFVFLDGDGKVLGRTTGEIEPDHLEAILDALRDGTELPLSVSGSSSGAG